jgi:hypothetical protein
MYKTVFKKILTVKITTKNFYDLAICLEDLIFCFLVGLNSLVLSVKNMSFFIVLFIYLLLLKVKVKFKPIRNRILILFILFRKN